MAEFIKQQDTRRTFIDTLVELAEKDDKIVLIVPDVGFYYIDEFQNRFPNRFFNFGVTETSTVLIASALALDGWKPYVYSMINFVLFRPYEAVRNGVVNHKANVKLIGVKGSTGYKFLGFSHNLSSEDEDIKVCENLGLEWVICNSPEDVSACIKTTHEMQQSFYIRL